MITAHHRYPGALPDVGSSGRVGLGEAILEKQNKKKGSETI